MMSEGPNVPPVRNWSPIIRLILGLLVGAAVTSLPWLVSRLGIESLWPINILHMPGTIVALIFSGWNVHTYDFSLLLAANVVFYTGLTYALLSIREKRKQSNRNHPSSTV
jgi:hypothetical protein